MTSVLFFFQFEKLKESKKAQSCLYSELMCFLYDNRIRYSIQLHLQKKTVYFGVGVEVMGEHAGI